MKYIVMECHDAYAVLMDETSRFVKAANLHYMVGQTVTEPILMDDEKKSVSPVIIMRRAGVIAACAALIAAGAYQYYAKNLKASSVVTIATETKFSMGINSKGEVLYLTSEDDSGAEILEDYDAKGKDQLTVANELLELEISKGYLAGGDFVDVVIDTQNSNAYEEMKSDFEKGIAELHLNANVVSKEEPLKPDTKIEPPVGNPDEVRTATPTAPKKPEEVQTPPTLPKNDGEKPKPSDEVKPPAGDTGDQKPPIKPPHTESGTVPIPPADEPHQTETLPKGVEPPAPIEPKGEKPDEHIEPPGEDKPILPPHAHQPQVTEPHPAENEMPLP